MDGPSKTINPACVRSCRAQASRGLGKKRPVEFKLYYKTVLSENLGTHCPEWPAGKANAEVLMLVEANSKPHPRRRNVNTTMVGLNNGNIRKNLTQNGEPKRSSWGTQKKT